MSPNGNPYKAYTKANHTVPKTKQVVMLYDGIIRNLKQAAEAMQNNQIEVRFNKLVRASEIMMGLQSSLDFESGGNAARVLYDFYSTMDNRVMHLHKTNDVEECGRIVDEVREMRDMWAKIDSGELDTETAQGPQTAQQPEQVSAAPAPQPAPAPNETSGEDGSASSKPDPLSGVVLNA
ncbi:MAG: flagellar export chaperone FliS [Rickettsiales bacterium]|nr:flagellar export chaperone FliS [Rickettsiales bacterium]